MSERFVVIMAGGRGERFWPASRLKRPKHLLPIVGDKPMLTQTVDRLEGLVPMENVFVITNVEQREAVLDVCPMLPPENVVGEPVGRDTSAAVGLAKALVKQRSPEGVFAMLPADHIIKDSAGFRSVLGAGFAAAEAASVLVTVGIAPTEPATGYGYIHKGAESSKADERPVYDVQKFVEKPDLETAKGYLASGEYYWNAGMFIWTVNAIEESFNNFVPTLSDAIKGIEAKLSTGADLAATLEECYPALEKISIDFAVMEKATNVVVIESDFDWDDVGAWPAIERHYPADDAGNVATGAAEILDASGNIIVGEDGHLTALIGVQDLIVVQTPDATLICPKEKAQEIKAMVKQLGTKAAYEHLM